YYFKTREQFEELIAADGLLEHAEYVGNYYGTPREPVERHLNEGRDVILEIEVQGAMQVKKRCPEAVLVFILPPSVETLRHRLQKRGTESAEVIEQRVKAAETELEMARYYDYTVVNDDLDKAVDDFLGVIEAAREKVRGRK
ncbi:MAG: guanylate kinase, partial [Oscillospiraceae bacterium]|nr:guanylate kinase [Oscillospiraceae bacterium]